jgi:hypothetical protein
VDTTERLAAIEEIRQVKARYFRFIDSKDRDGLRSVFARDAVLDHTQAEMDHVVRGGDAIADSITLAVAEITTVHHGHMAEIELDSPTTARAVFAMEDMLWWNPGGPFKHMHGYGHYHEDYVLEDGQWKISLNRLTRLRVDVEMW